MSDIFNMFFTSNPVGLEAQGQVYLSAMRRYNGKLLVRIKEGVGTEFRVILPLENIPIDNNLHY